jgi:hypothetical protein
MTDEPMEMTGETVALLENRDSPEATLAADKALFAKITGEEFSSPTPKKAETASQPDPEPEETEAEAPEAPIDPRVDAARKGLAQAGYPKTSVEGASDEEALGWWNRHTEQDFDRTSAKEQALDLQKRLNALEETRQEPVEPPKPLLDPAPMLSALKEQFGDEAGEQLSGVFQDYVGKALDEMNGRVGGLESTWKDAEKRSSDAMTAANRSRLQTAIPQLENDMAWKAIEDTASTLLGSGKTFLSADQLFDEAAKVMYGDVSLETVADKTSKQKKKIRSAAPTTESRKGAPETLSSADSQKAKDWESFQRTETKRKAGGYR